MLKRTAALCAAACLLIPAMAQAHVSVHPNTVPEGAFATLDIRVPGEEENAYAYRVDTLFPAGFTDVGIQNVPSWTAKVVKKKLAKPIQTADGPVTEDVSQVIWTGDRSVDGRLDNGTFMQFPLSIAMPENTAGKSLAFKTLESYSNGKVVHWIGAPNAEFPGADNQHHGERRCAARRRRGGGRPRARRGAGNGSRDCRRQRNERRHRLERRRQRGPRHRRAGARRARPARRLRGAAALAPPDGGRCGVLVRERRAAWRGRPPYLWMVRLVLG